MKPARATAWCRVDFAGGTLDIWPLGLLHRGASTVNVAVALPVSVALAPRARGYRLVSPSAASEYGSIAELAASHDGALAGVVAESIGLPPCEILVESASPRGAGLGASSALTVALLAAAELAIAGELRQSPLERARSARDLEARLMGLPTGMQDHLAAQLGGALAVEHEIGGERVTPLALDLDELGRHLLVAYTGQSHFSAGANWRVIRGRLNGEPAIVERLERIRDAARAVRSALERGDWSAAGAAVAAEWQARRGLSSEVSTEAIEALLAAARERGAWGGKACGAGGGGCVAVLAPPAAGEAIRAAWRDLGGQLLESARPTARRLEAG